MIEERTGLDRAKQIVEDVKEDLAKWVNCEGKRNPGEYRDREIARLHSELARREEILASLSEQPSTQAAV